MRCLSAAIACLLIAGCGDSTESAVEPVSEPVELAYVVERMKIAYASIDAAEFHVYEQMTVIDSTPIEKTARVVFKAPDSFHAVVEGFGKIVHLFSDGETYTEIGVARTTRDFALDALDSMMPAKDLVIFFFDWERLLGDEGVFSEDGWAAVRRTDRQEREWIVVERGQERFLIDPQEFIAWRYDGPTPDGGGTYVRYLQSFARRGSVAPQTFVAPVESQ